MNRNSLIGLAGLALVLSGPALADETGTGEPEQTTQSTQTTTESTTTDCGLIESWLGLCTASEDGSI